MAPRDRNFTSAGDVLFFEVVHKVGDFEYLQVLQGGPSDSVYKPLTFAFFGFWFSGEKIENKQVLVNKSMPVVSASGIQPGMAAKFSRERYSVL